MSDWQPTANFDILKQRAAMIDAIRHFFKERDILEVETPILSRHTVTDRFIESFSVKTASQTYYLQTSPEYAMKRLLCAGSGSIFQMSKAFRNDECGQQHNPEFTLLEWYRPGFTHHDLMDEMDDLLMMLLKTGEAERITYQKLFQKHCGIDPLHCEDDAIKQQLKNVDTHVLDRDTALQLLFSQNIEPALGIEIPTFVYDFPASQAALAKISKDNPLVAERFEVFIHGMEIANGFYELTDAKEQQQRFESDQQHRKANQQSIPDIDKRFIAALEAGLPDCAGVALGIDRLMMCVKKTKNIQDVMAFSWETA